MADSCKSRMISFRVTQNDYDRFHNLCLTRGIASVSELARAAIEMVFQQTSHQPKGELESRVAEIEVRLEALSLELRNRGQTTVPEFVSSPAQG